MLKTLIVLSVIFGNLLQAPTPLPPAGGIGQGPLPTSSQPTPTTEACDIKAGCEDDGSNSQATDPLVYVGGGRAAALAAGGGIWAAVSRRKSGEAPEKPSQEEKE